MSGVRTTLRALPTLLRIGIAETIAYRAEFLIWMLTTTLPLVMLGLWTSVAAERPFQGFESADFVAYYLAALIVRNLTGSWVVWQINEEIRQGQMSMRLLRPIHPFVAYAGTHISAVPLRAAVALPVAVILLVSSARGSITHEPSHLLMLIPSLAAAWVLTFAVLLAIGSLAFLVDRSVAVLNVYFGVFAVLSGYLVPLTLLPWWAQELARWSPFRFMLSAPIEILLGRTLGFADVAGLVALQAGWALVACAVALAVWRAGVRRFEAYGG